MSSLSSQEVRAYVLAHLRLRYARGLALLKRLETENRDARQAGVSFAEREALYGRRLRAGNGLLAVEAAAGSEASRAAYEAQECLQDVRDAYDLWEPWGLSTPAACEVSPVKVN